MHQPKKRLVVTLNLKDSMEFLLSFDTECRKVIKKNDYFHRKANQGNRGKIDFIGTRQIQEANTLAPSVKGINIALATARIVTTDRCYYFDNAKQLSRYLRLWSTYQQSEMSVNVQDHINPNGDPSLKSQLYVAAFSSLLYNLECKACFDRL